MADAEDEKKPFKKTFGEKYLKAVKSLDKDWDKLRTKVTKGAGNASIAAALGFKLLIPYS